MKLFILTIIGALLVFATPTRASDDVIQVQFKTHITSAGATIPLKDMIDNDRTDLEFMQRYGNIVLTSVAAEAEQIDPAQIMALLSKSGADMTKIQFKQFGSIALERGQSVDLPSEFKQKIVNELNAMYGIPTQDVIFSNARVQPKLPAESTNMKFSNIVLGDLTKLDQARIMATLTNTDGSSMSYDFTVALNITTTTLTAAEDIPAGTTLTDNKFWSARSTINSLSGRILLPTSVKGKLIKTTSAVAKGEVILASAVQEAHEVARGKVVTVSYKTAQIDIKTQGTLLDNAEVGALVRVENLESKRSITGRLLSEDLVEVADAKQ